MTSLIKRQVTGCALLFRVKAVNLRVNSPQRQATTGRAEFDRSCAPFPASVAFCCGCPFWLRHQP